RDHRSCFTNLLDTRYEREQDPKAAMACGTQQRTQLDAEQIRSREAQTQAAETLAARPRLVRLPPGRQRVLRESRGQLLFIDVEGPYRHRPRGHPLEHAPVDLVLP